MWALSLLSYLPILRTGLDLSHQWLGVLFFLSCLILTLSWALAGPLTAAALSFLSSIIVIYLTLSVKEPAVFLQLIIYGTLFVAVVSYLQRIQRHTNDKQILREKLSEDIHITQEEFHKKTLLENALERKIHRLKDLQHFSEDLKGMKELDEVANKIVREAQSFLPKAEECVLYLVNENKEDLSLIASTTQKGTVVKEKEGTVFDHWVMKKSQSVMIGDAQNDFRFSAAPKARALYHQSICASPLVTENKVLGVLRASAPEESVFTSDDVRLLDIFATLGAVSLRNILLYQKMGELAIRDSLTGIYLNRYFQDRLGEEIQRIRGEKKSFSLLLLDIDFFKRYNDEYGHAAGDIVLKNVASVIAKNLEPADLLARYGGEEFIVLLPNKGAKDAKKVAEKIRTAIEQNRFSIRRVEGSVTASLGVATYPGNGHTKEELFWSVDRHLYEAKRLGRNRVCGSI